ncbi:MAG: DNA repair protein RecO [Flavobacteriales bacterium]|nr:MAG: DNA repair protein RecO [Flavobacteriales bacterium]
MLHTTKGIVIHHFKYGEKSVIAKIYTQKYGLQSYILNGVRNQKSKNKAIYIQPLSLVEINAFYKEKNGLQQIKNIQLDIPFNSIPFNINKSSIAFFIAEILYKSIKEEESNSKLFDFLYNAIQILDLKESHFNNFHLLFMAHFSKYLGFYPQMPNTNNNVVFYFDLQEGSFMNLQPYHQAFIALPLSSLIYHVFGTSFDAMETLVIDTKQRRLLLNSLLDYYSLHLSNFDNLKTLDILEEVLS